MLRHSLAAVTVVALVSACGATNKPTPNAAIANHRSGKGTVHIVERAKAEQSDAESKAAANAFRRVGDFHVYQYTGSFAKQPLTLTEQVVAKEGDALVVDFVLEEGENMNALRVNMREDGEVLKVRRITDDGDAPATIADYDAMMKRTELLPDTNDRTLSTDHTTCLVGDEQVDCDMTTYGVTVAGKHAKLMITKSARVPGRDIGGDIVAEDGRVLYSARLIERGNEPPVTESLARLDRLELPPR